MGCQVHSQVESVSRPTLPRCLSKQPNLARQQKRHNTHTPEASSWGNFEGACRGVQEFLRSFQEFSGGKEERWRCFTAPHTLSSPSVGNFTRRWTCMLSLTLCTALHCTFLHCTALHYTVLQCTTLYCSALHCTALHYTVLHCTA